jgi:hypothetical protein
VNLQQNGREKRPQRQPQQAAVPCVGGLTQRSDADADE